MINKDKLFATIKDNIIVYWFYYHVMTLFVNVLKLFVVPDNKLILFVSYGGRYYNDSPRCIYEQMRCDERFAGFKLVWAFKNPDQYEDSISKVKIDTFKYYLTALKARAWVTNVVIERGLDFTGKHAFYFHTTHGDLPKLTGYDAKDTMLVAKHFKYKFDYSIAQTEYDRQLQTRMYGLRLEQIESCGFPKNDVLTKVTEEDVRSLRKKLGIPLDKKVILYAPTFRGSITDTMDCGVDFKLWEEVLGNQYVVLYRAHPVMASISKNDSSSGFVFDYSGYPDNNELMALSDILISDYSGIFFEFGVLKREMFCFAYDYDEYIKTWALYFDIRDELPGGHLKERELLEYIKNGNRKEIAGKLEAFSKKYINDSGKATKRCVDIIYEHINKQ